MKSLLALPLFLSLLNASVTLPGNFESDFKQTLTNEKGKTISYQGSVFFKYNKEILIDDMGKEIEIGNGLFKWIYNSPVKKEVCSDGQEILVIDHELEQVSRYLIDNGVDLEEILKHAEQVNANEYKAIYKEVEYLIFVDATEQLQKIAYTDNLDNRVEIEFQKMQYDIQGFDEHKLECPFSNDYDMIEG